MSHRHGRRGMPSMAGDKQPMRMNRLGLATAAGMALVVTMGPSARGESPQTPAADALSGDQRRQVEEMIHDYLLKNPEVILESVRSYQMKREAQADENARAALVANRGQLGGDATAPQAGNPKGDVTIVEFFDYNCGYCKRMVPVIQEILATDKQVRYVFKEYPILRPDSETGAKAALAVWKLAPDKYLPFHMALMSGRGELSEERIFKTAESVGVDRTKLQAAMNDPAIRETLQRNRQLGQILNINGTPAFIVGDQMQPGAIDVAALREMIANARNGARPG